MGWEGKRPFPPEFGLSLPVVGQFYKGSQASVMLSEARKNGYVVFLKAEPHNQYDKNAFKVLCWNISASRFVHVGYVQRHSASRLKTFLSSTNDSRCNFSTLNDVIVCQLSSVRPDAGDMQFLEVTPKFIEKQSQAEDVIEDYFDRVCDADYDDELEF